MVDKSLSRGLADRVLDEMAELSRAYTERVGRVLGTVPQKRHAIQDMASAIRAAGEAACLTQVIGRHPKWRWASTCAFIPHLKPRENAAERIVAFLAIRTYLHVDRAGLVDPNLASVLAVNEHAIERMFQRLNVLDPAAVKEELHDAICMSVYLLNAARRARLNQVVVPTGSGAFLCSVERDGLVARTWIASPDEPCRHTEPARLARKHFQAAGGQAGLGAAIAALPIDAPLSVVDSPSRLAAELSDIAWLREPYFRRADPVGDNWRNAARNSSKPAPLEQGESMNKTIMVEASQETCCPNCGHTFPLSDGISRQTVERFAEHFETQWAERRKLLEAELESEAGARAERQFTAQVSALREALAAKEAFMADLRNGELELRRQLRDAEAKQQNQKLEYQRKLDEERRAIEERARASASDEFNRKEAQWRAQIESAQREAADLKRKLEQGQTQGEAAELILASVLRSAFPFDEFLPVAKGVSGADLVQRVRSPSGQECGTILWETKQTKNWSGAWLPKLKHTQQELGAEIAVLVTSAMPQDCREPFVRESDVWVIRAEAVRPLAEALRTTLLELHKLRQANIGRNEKMELLYNYICSPQFAQRAKAVVDGFAAVQADLEAEKTAMMRIWKKRETQLARLSGGILGVVGELQGLGQEMLPRLDGVGALTAVTQQEEAEPSREAA